MPQHDPLSGRRPPARSPLAGGFLIAVGALVGAVVGATRGQSSAGLLIGIGAGAVLSLAIWAIDRRRR